jgi:hypothetical protein
MVRTVSARLWHECDGFAVGGAACDAARRRRCGRDRSTAFDTRLCGIGRDPAVSQARDARVSHATAALARWMHRAIEGAAHGR